MLSHRYNECWVLNLCTFSEGRRFISEDRKEGDVYDTLHLGTKLYLVKNLNFFPHFAVLIGICLKIPMVDLLELIKFVLSCGLNLLCQLNGKRQLNINNLNYSTVKHSNRFIKWDMTAWYNCIPLYKITHYTQLLYFSLFILDTHFYNLISKLGSMLIISFQYKHQLLAVILGIYSSW